jgi:DNA-binding response OmpR family regulator
VYQAGPPLATDGAGPVQVVLIFDVPAGFTELPSRTARLADEYGRVIANSVAGVQVRPAMIAAVNDASGSTLAPIARFQGLLIDRARREVRVGGLPVRLSYREFELLCFLAEHPRQPVSRARLIREVWDVPVGTRETELSGRTVDTHVRRLRVKLGSHAGVITTIRGRGYRFDAGTDVRYVPAGAVPGLNRSTGSR